jgi:hypothetical protein
LTFQAVLRQQQHQQQQQQTWLLKRPPQPLQKKQLTMTCGRPPRAWLLRLARRLHRNRGRSPLQLQGMNKKKKKSLRQERLLLLKARSEPE